ncbi:MAG: N-acetyl-gamma-glutamyl-phosphate reductase [Bacteroidota bacterium]
MEATPTVSIVGASGYSGAELYSLLSRHSSVRIGKLFANTSAGKPFFDVFPRFSVNSKHSDAPVLEQYSPDAACSSELIFIALPSGEAMRIVPELLQRGKRIIDLGGDFRLKNVSVYEHYYKHQHSSPALLNQAVYGLPEWNREAIRKANLVANPGCYPTSALLPLLPLLKEKVIRDDGIVINSLSGVSGAGRSASPEMSFAEVNESVKAYKVAVHQHTPEIRSVLSDLTGRKISVSFVPHLLPITRGIYTSIYAPLAQDASLEHILEVFRSHYDLEPFIRFSQERIPEIKHVTNTNFLDIGFRIDRENNMLILISSLDNLFKGAAGQAVQNMNIMFGLNETEGLL